jgi:Ca-activated chloride channel family protein
MIVLFLTDGLPTAGVTDLTAILADVEARAAENVRFFTFGVGDDVNTFLLDELSQRYHGASAYVRPGEKVDESVNALYSKVSAPLLTDLSLEFDGAVVYDVYPPLDRLPDLFAGSQLIVTGRYRREDDQVTLRLRGSLGDQTQTFTYADQTFRTNAGGDVLIPRLWATRRIGELLNEIRLKGETPELVDSIVRLSIRYGIITPYTSFIITEQDIFTQEDVAQAAATMQPTALAMAANASGNSAVNAAQQAGGMSQSALVATIPPNAHVMLNVTSTPAALYPSTPLPTPSPLGTLNVVDNMAASAVPQVSTLPPFTPTPLPYPGQDASGVPAQTVRAVGDRTFVWRDSVWIDTTYDPDTMEPREIVFLSDEYFDLLDQDERVAEFLALGEHVIFVLDGQAYEVVPEG